MTTSGTDHQQSLTARSPEDLLAVARVVLGFEPADSVVMLTVGSGQSFHARVDLPTRESDLDDVTAALVGPAVGHRVEATVLLLYTRDATRARRAARTIRRALERERIGVIDAIRADAGRWYPLFRDRRGLGATGVPYDICAHPFVVAAVFDGRVLHGSRGDLAATLAEVPDAVAAVAAARPVEPAGADWVRDQVGAHLSGATAPGPVDAARLLESVADPAVRQVAWCGIRRDDARDHVRFWSDIVRRAPREVLAHAASVAAFAAWVAGDGALAWCAVDRARSVDPDHPLADLVEELLVQAVPPSEWEAMAPRYKSTP